MRQLKKLKVNLMVLSGESMEKFIHTCTDKKDNKVFIKYIEIHNGIVAKSYMTNGLLIQYMVKYLRISSYIRKPFLIYDFATAPF